MTVDAIKSRLGSIGPRAMQGCPNSVQRILREDLPQLLEIAELASCLLGETENWLSFNTGARLFNALERLGKPNKPGPEAA